MFSILKYILGGGKLKYRVVGCNVEMKGGGTGWFWYHAHFTDCDTPEQAEFFAKRWAENEGGVVVPNAELTGAPLLRVRVERRVMRLCRHEQLAVNAD